MTLPTTEQLNAAVGRVVAVTVAFKGDDHCLSADCSEAPNAEDVIFVGRLVRWDEDGEAVLDHVEWMSDSVKVRTWVWPMLKVDALA